MRNRLFHTRHNHRYRKWVCRRGRGLGRPDLPKRRGPYPPQGATLPHAQNESRVPIEPLASISHVCMPVSSSGSARITPRVSSCWPPPSSVFVRLQKKDPRQFPQVPSTSVAPGAGEGKSVEGFTRGSLRVGNSGLRTKKPPYPPLGNLTVRLRFLLTRPVRWSVPRVPCFPVYSPGSAAELT